MANLSNQGASTTEYWATAKGEELMAALDQRVTDYYEYINRVGLFDLWKRCHQAYYQALYVGGRIGKAGSNSQFTTIAVNHLRNFTQHLVTLTIDSRPTFEPRATNTDMKSQAQTLLAKNLLDYYMREKHLESILHDATKYAVLYAEGYVMPSWDAHSGKVYAKDPETGIEQMEGDLAFQCFMPLDVIRNPAVSSLSSNTWYITREVANKWDLAAKYPEVAEEITSTSMDFDPRRTFDQTDYSTSANSDMIYLYTLIHDRTPALPQGRQVQFTESVLLTDSVLPYLSLNLYRITSDPVYDKPFSYSASFDLLSLQQGVNLLHSTILTNQAAFGVQNITSKRGSAVKITEVKGGMNLIEYEGDGPPEALNLTATPAEIFNYLEKLESEMETLSGVNSVARGNIPSAGMSGAALALIQSMAIQFSQPLQASYVKLLEDVGTAMIGQLKEYASVPRIAMIAGKSNRGLMKEFSGQDLSEVNRVMVDVGSPLSRTTSGKLEIAQLLLQSKAISTSDELLQVINTGALEPLTEGATHELIAIRAENEALSDNIPVPVVITDNHLLHIAEHKSILSDPDARRDPELIQTVTDHLMQHLNILQDPANANLLQLLGQTPVPPQPGAAPPPGAMSAPPGPSASPNAQVQAQQPGMPINPLSGQPWNPENGGLPANNAQPQ
jgi:hypothetical protein